jgi:hypothetical protein
MVQETTNAARTGWAAGQAAAAATPFARPRLPSPLAGMSRRYAAAPRRPRRRHAASQPIYYAF